MKTLTNCFFLKLICFILFSFVSFQLKAQEKTQNATNILFIGNSFTFMHDMPATLEKIATLDHQKVNVFMSAKPSHTFKMHAKRDDLYKDISTKKWDYVVLQGFSSELTHGKKYIDTAIVPYVNKIIDTLKKNNPCVNILLYMTWGYQEGHTTKYKNTMSFKEMSDSIENGYIYLSQKNHTITIVPVGRIWQQVREKYPSYELYSTDGIHPSELGSYLIATSFFSSIFFKENKTDYFANLDSLQVKTIQKLTHEYIQLNKKKFHLENQGLELDYVNDNTNCQIRAFAHFPNAHSFEWNFGDKTIRKDVFEVDHTYLDYGEYTIKVKMQDSICGIRTAQQTVFFNSEILDLDIDKKDNFLWFEKKKRKK